MFYLLSRPTISQPLVWLCLPSISTLSRGVGTVAYETRAKEIRGQPFLDRTVEDWRYLVDWRLQRQRPFVVIDPNDPENLMYISERDYKDLQKVCLSNDFPLTVIARKGTSPPEGWDAPAANSQNTPLTSGGSVRPGRRVPLGTDVPFVRSGLWNHIRASRSWIARLLKLSRKDSMVDVSKIPRGIFFLTVVWGRALMHYCQLGRPGYRLRLLTALGNHLQHLVVNQGVTTTIARLKIYLFCLYSYLGGDPIKTTQDLGSRIRLTHGLPSCFPLEVRQSIRSGSLATIRWWASLLNMYKAISGPHSLAGCLDSVVAPRFMGDIGQFSENVIELWTRFSDQLGFIPVYRPRSAYGRISMKSGPNGPFAWWRQGVDALAWLLAPRNLPRELALAWGLNDFVTKFTNAQVTAWKLSENREIPEPSLGALALLREAAGKIRPIAMVDIWTQWLLKPLHDWLLELLRGLPTDATWDQEGTLRGFVERIGPSRAYYCYDLKNATDRIPMDLYVEMFTPLLGREVVDLWRLILVDRWYTVPRDAIESGYPDKVRYTRGQPMGAYSSWASLAWVHHFLVQLAHLRVGGSGFFLDYLVLGDDLVIADKEVAESYLQLCEAFGITVGIAKSFTAVGLVNFANKTYWKTDNVSPLSLKEELLARSWPARVSLASRVTDLWYSIGSKERTHTVLRNMVGPSVWNVLQTELQAPSPHGIISALSLVALNPLALGRASVLNTQVISEWLRTHVLKPVQTFGSLTPDFTIGLLLVFYNQLEKAQVSRLALLRRWRQLVSISWHHSQVELLLHSDSIAALMDLADSLKESTAKTKAYIERITWGAGGLGWWAGGAPGRSDWAKDRRSATPECALKWIEGILDHLIKINSELPCRVEHILTPFTVSEECAQSKGSTKGPCHSIIPHIEGIDYDGTKLGNLPWIAGPIEVPLYAPLFSSKTLREGEPEPTTDAVSIPVAEIEALCLRHYGESPLISALLGPSNQGKRARSLLSEALAAYTRTSLGSPGKPYQPVGTSENVQAYGGPIPLSALDTTSVTPAVKDEGGKFWESSSEETTWMDRAAEIVARQQEINLKATRLAEWRSSLTTYRPGREIRMRNE